MYSNIVNLLLLLTKFFCSMDPSKVDIVDFFEIHQNVTLSFNIFPTLPFPLYLSPTLQMTISVLMTISLIYGLHLRKIIFSYLFRSGAKFKPIDYLILLDQLNGLFQSFSILFSIIALNVSDPLSNIFGETFCKWIDLPGLNYSLLNCKQTLQFF